MDFLLRDLRWHNGREIVTGDIRLSKGIIAEMGMHLRARDNETVESFQSQFLYPGLINAHDHLEMNLYPKLGTPPYDNYVDWANDIYKPAESPVREIEKLDIQDRLLWGGIKNLIAGVTTVAHHNPWHRSMENKTFPVKVLRIAWAHSLAFEKKVIMKWPKKKNIPFVIHVAEGIDALAHSEVPHLEKLGLLSNNTVLIHAIGLNDQDVESIDNAGAAVVWCPASNLFMFRQTAPILKLKNKIRVALGCDSTLTGSPTLLHELRAARETDLATTKEIFGMVTKTPAAIFHLSPPVVAVGHSANLFTARAKSENYYENLPALSPADISLVLKDGLPQLKDTGAENDWKILKNRVKVNGVPKRCFTDIGALRTKIQKVVPLEILEKNPLWQLIET